MGQSQSKYLKQIIVKSDMHILKAWILSIIMYTLGLSVHPYYCLQNTYTAQLFQPQPTLEKRTQTVSLNTGDGFAIDTQFHEQ